MTVYRFSSEELSRPIPFLDGDVVDKGILEAARTSVDHYAIRQGQPIVIDDQWDLDEQLTQFATMVSRTERSELTALTYTREAEVFSRYLAHRGRQLTELVEDDLWDYRNARLNGSLEVRLKPTSWNKVAAALLRLLRHLKLNFDGIRWRDFRASVEVDDRVRMISLPDYLRFRNVGMAGNRNRLRNTAFADLLVTSGARCTEGALLLRHEVPDRSRFEAHNTIMVELPATITKWEKRRDVPFSKRFVRHFLDPYVEEERAHVVASSIARLFPRKSYSIDSLESLSNFIFFERVEGKKIRIIAGDAEKLVVPMAKLTQRERKKLVEVAANTNSDSFKIIDFGFLWVSEVGSCVTNSTWLSTFDAACVTVGPDGDPELKVTPHMLRHTFAVHHLSFMLKGLLDVRAERGRLDRRGEVYDRVVGDPLRQLQTLLGHRSIQTTYKYLTYVEDNQELVARATEGWDATLGWGS